MRRRLKSKNEVILAPVHPNVGIELAYRRKLYKLIDQMNNSVVYWLSAKYRQNEPRVVALAQDETPAEAMRRAMAALRKRWTSKFDVMADELAKYFAQDMSQRSDAALKAILKKGGFAVDFKMTPAMRDILQASVAENVSLIKSIPQQYLTQVEGIVMRGVQAGNDLGQVSSELRNQFGVTKRRAALIARDQSNKINANLTRARQLELGIKEAIWSHSLGGKEPRPTHLAAGKAQTRYDIAKGWFDSHEGKYIWPGQLINCRCVAKAVVPGLS